MSEVEYDLMLEAVQTAIAPAPEDDFVVRPSGRIRRRAPPTTTGPLAAAPFPEGWYAAC